MSAQTVTGAKAGSRRRLLGDPAVRSLIAASAAVGVAGAFVVPTTSLFLAKVVAATPLMVGLFFAARSIAEIGTDVVVGAISDRLRNRRTILVMTALLNTAGALCYTFLRDYYLLLVTGIMASPHRIPEQASPAVTVFTLRGEGHPAGHPPTWTR